MKWRIYRLPGDREWWRIDNGKPCRTVFVRQFKAKIDAESINGPGHIIPRGWIQVNGDLHIIDGIAVFSFPGIPLSLAVPELMPIPEVKKEES
jgi:hypothetical protein